MHEGKLCEEIQGEHHVKMKAEIWVIPPYTSECQRQLPEAGRTWDRFCLTARRRNQPCGHIDLGLRASRTGRQISVVQTIQFVVVCCDSDRKHTQPQSFSTVSLISELDDKYVPSVLSFDYFYPRSEHRLLFAQCPIVLLVDSYCSMLFQAKLNAFSIVRNRNCS